MKNIFLSVVVISALVVAGIGGTLADFSDSEEEMGDSVQAGSMDLKVNGQNDPNVIPFRITGMKPDKWYDVTKTVANAGTIDGWLYIHIKNVLCEETDDKGFKPEPEIVAELGGKHGQKQVPGVGERCDMENHIAVEIRYDGVLVDLSAYDTDPASPGVIKLNELQCFQIPIPTPEGENMLEACGVEHTINFNFLLQDVPESYYGLDIFDETDPHELKWEHWPTNCYMGDTLSFDVLYELLQTDYTPPGGP
jgi:hypothetical protein